MFEIHQKDGGKHQVVVLGIAYNVVSALGGMKPVFQERNVAFVANRKPTTVVSNVCLERPVAIVKPDLIRG